jgi:hypothetical protein
VRYVRRTAGAARKLEGFFSMSMQKLIATAAAGFLMSAGAAHAVTTTPVPIDGYYTVTYSPTINPPTPPGTVGTAQGNKPTFTKPSDTLGTFTGTTSSSTTEWKLNGATGYSITPGNELSEMNLFIANPAGSCGSGCVNSTASGTITVNFTFTSGTTVIGSLKETGEYQAKYGGTALGCTNSPTGNTDCLNWADPNGTIDTAVNGSVLLTTTLSGFPNDTIDLTFFNANDWSMTPGIVLGVNDPSGGGGQQTPLPAALPLFAGGLGLVGLIAWRRKRKAELSTTEGELLPGLLAS